MFLGDVHTHSRCSPDGAFPMAEMARAAAENGLGYLCVTDHCDLLDLNGVFTPDYDWAPLRTEYEEALAALPEGLSLHRGVELGEAYEAPEVALGILSAAPELDFVIGSVHNFHAILGKQDFYNADYSDEAVCHAALEDYLDSMLALTALPQCYDTLAHILYPLRYMHKAGQAVSFAQRDYPDRLRAILRRVADDGKALEVNTWRGRTVDGWEPILRMFRDVGGQYVTVGSDAHDLAHLGAGVKAAYDLLGACGFAHTTVFEKRTPIRKEI